MPQFAYRAKDSGLNVVEGTIEADTEAAAISRLGRQGVFPISIVESGSARPSAALILPSRISKHTLAYVTRQLADLLGGGLPLLSALNLLAKQTAQRPLQRVIDRIAGGVRDGRPLSAAPLSCSSAEHRSAGVSGTTACSWCSLSTTAACTS